MGNHLVATAFHHHRHRAVTVHLASALQVWVSDASTTSESLTRRALTRMGNPQLTPPRERSGLASRVGCSRVHTMVSNPSVTRVGGHRVANCRPAGVVVRV